MLLHETREGECTVYSLLFLLGFPCSGAMGMPTRPVVNPIVLHCGPSAGNSVSTHRNGPAALAAVPRSNAAPPPSPRVLPARRAGWLILYHRGAVVSGRGSGVKVSLLARWYMYFFCCRTDELEV